MPKSIYFPNFLKNLQIFKENVDMNKRISYSEPIVKQNFYKFSYIIGNREFINTRVENGNK
ncbi:hypothetical protein FACS189485_12530 [Spirochaetia bacterium]|nr:hypothetical protein FACS189485_12530 [Spirochaetia bacterium]